MIEMCRETPERPGGRNDRVARLVERLDRLRQRGGNLPVAVSAELPHERRIHRVPADCGGRLDLDPEILPRRPLDGRPARRDETAFRLEHTDFDQRQRQGKHPVSRRVHLDIVPLHAEQGAPFFVEFDEFAPTDCGPPDGRAQNRTSGPAFESAEDESDRIARIKNSPLRADALLHDPDS